MKTNLLVSKSKIFGEFFVPPSKSHTMRAILFASLADGKSRISNYLRSPDTFAMINACTKIGAKIEINKNELVIKGVGGELSVTEDIVDASNAGQVMYYFGAVCGLSSGYTVITGDRSLREIRSVKDLLLGLNQLGATAFSLKGNNFVPILIKGPMKPSIIKVNGFLSQTISALIIAASFMEGETEIFVENPNETPWIQLTLNWLDRLKIKYEQDSYKWIKIYGMKKIAPFDFAIPGDFSQITYPIVTALINHSSITIKHLDMKDAQGDKKVIDIFRKMGANINYDEKNGALIVSSPAKLHALKEINVSDFIDAITILPVIACFCEGETKITGALSARQRESDRLSTICCELKKMGANIIELKDGLIVKKSKLHNSVDIDSHKDHRIAMSLATAGMSIGETTIIKDINCINKSFPDFVDAFKQAGANIMTQDTIDNCHIFGDSL